MVEATTTPSNLVLPTTTLSGTTTIADMSSANATINIVNNSYTSSIPASTGTQVLHTATPLTE